jgi:hypothetical protein
VLRGGDVTGEWLLNNIQIGDTIDLNLVTNPDWQNYQLAISGGPRLLLDGAFWQDCDENAVQPRCEEFDERYRNTHYYDMSIPRSVIGYNEAGTILYMLVVEGYEVEDSSGMTQQQVADMLIEFGAYQAMEFDGGGSSTLWVAPNGPINDFGYEGERPVTNAVIVYWND